MREIVFDTETTGLDPFSGDKLVEIGAVELIDQIPTGRKFHEYINPMRSMSEEVIKIHGLTEEFLSDKPTFEEICDDFLAFVGDDSVLVAHNATFDMKFINCELASVGREKISNDRVVDTLVIARKRFPGSSVNLDELCRRFHIDNSARTVHGALLDAELLADVYLELMGGREPDLVLGNNGKKTVQNDEEKNKEKVFRAPREFPVSEIELEAHKAFMDQFKNPLWYAKDEEETPAQG